MMHEITDCAAARLFWALGKIIRELGEDIPKEEQATYATIIAVRLAAWLIGHGANTEDEIDALIRLHQEGMKDEARRPLLSEEGEALQALAEELREGRLIFPEVQGHAD
jgi:hypothetical protein